MRNTQLFRTALKFAAHKHAGQVRKGTDVPYLIHPVEVALFLQNLGMNYSVIVAGYLHDTLEDTDTTLEEIESIFGKSVADIVEQVTEPDKKKALKKAESYTMDAIKVKTADLACNISDILDNYSEIGDAIWDRFTHGKKTLVHYKKMAELLRERGGHMPVIKTELDKILTNINTML